MQKTSCPDIKQINQKGMIIMRKRHVLGKIAVLRYCRKKQHAPAGTYQRDFGPVED